MSEQTIELPTTCRTCEFWLECPPTLPPRTGQCLRHAPRPNTSGVLQMTHWPTTAAGNWCGEHKPTEYA